MFVFQNTLPSHLLISRKHFGSGMVQPWNRWPTEIVEYSKTNYAIFNAKHCVAWRQRDQLNDLVKSLPACSPSELQRAGTEEQELSVKEMLFAPVQSGAWLVKGENTLENSGNGLKFPHFPFILCPGSMCWGHRSSDFINRVVRGRKLALCELFSSLACPHFTNLLPPFPCWCLTPLPLAL